MEINIWLMEVISYYIFNVVIWTVMVALYRYIVTVIGNIL